MANPHWLTFFPNSKVLFAPPGISDHSSIILRTGIHLPKLYKPFKFFNYWADHPSFVGLVEEVWKADVSGSPLYRVATKLKLIKAKLKVFNQTILVTYHPGSPQPTKIFLIFRISWRSLLLACGYGSLSRLLSIIW